MVINAVSIVNFFKILKVVGVASFVKLKITLFACCHYKRTIRGVFDGVQLFISPLVSIVSIAG